MMKFIHTFHAEAPIARVAEFHSQSASMAAITPPAIRVRVHSAPRVLAEGDEMDFTLWLGPLPVRWLARIEAVSSTGFTDRQLRGPFEAWSHHHSYTAVTPQVTEVRDEITLCLRRHSLWWAVGLSMRLGLPALFAYRGWKTRQLLKAAGAQR